MSSSPDPTPSPEVIEAAAAAWLSLRDRGMSAAETAEFVRWLEQDPQHAAMFAELDRVWRDLDRLDAVPAPAAAPAPPDADLLAPRLRAHRRRRFGWAVLGAAAVVALLLGLSFFRTPSHTAETAVGAFQKIDMPDGSVAQLNTDSAIDTAFTAAERRVRVVRGEVFFTVTKDPARPFVVISGAVAVRAVGTAFNVRQRDSAVEVLVTEGRVRLDDTRQSRSLLPAAPSDTEPPLLLAGERAVVPLPSRSSAVNSPRATVEKVSPSAAQRALAWQERRLEFDGVPLADVVSEFNRYNLRHLVIADPALAAKRFSGTFRADGYESLVQLLEADFGVRAARHETEIVLHARP
ncbi:MAG: FecR domain-containing protein [Verrucomicrobia bacterium]|nr:FecR domain-containing protein [Verrucomicrobiota bacterium]